MPGWLKFLLDTSPFKVPTACGGWTDLLAHATIASNLGIFAVFVSIAILLLSLMARRGEPALILRRRFTWAFSALTFWCGLTHLMRAGSFWWPAYRLQVVVNVITVIISWATVIIIIPMVLQQTKDPFLRGVQTLQEELRQLREMERELRSEISTSDHPSQGSSDGE